MLDWTAFPQRGWLVLPLIALGLSAVTTAWLIVYARKRQLLDQPGKRRSHSSPTPRGGGLGIVLAVLSCGFLPLYQTEKFQTDVFTIFMGSVLVAAIGWWDDHHPLSAKLRFVVHVAAACLFAISLELPGMVMLGVITLSCAWSINLHNFMDGIDGLLAMQALFVVSVIGFLAWNAADPFFAIGMFTLTGAVMGFLFFNFPRAKIFMGDVGSGTLGFLIAAFLWLGYSDGIISLFEGLILTVAFVVDGTCTLLSRMMMGRRWYHPHREHLYQWFVRTGSSHAQVVMGYLAWNIVIVVPALWLSIRFPQQILLTTLVLYGFAIGCWFFGKKICLYRYRVMRNHAHAIA